MDGNQEIVGPSLYQSLLSSMPQMRNANRALQYFASKPGKEALLRISGLIPYIGIPSSLYSEYISARDWLELEMVIRFIAGLQVEEEGEIRNLIEKLETDPVEKERFGKNVLLCIHRLDDFGKPELLSRIAIAKLKDNIDMSEFQALGRVISTLSLESIREFGSIYDETGKLKKQSLDEGGFEYFAAGLLTIPLRSQKDQPFYGSIHFFPSEKFSISKLGHLFYSILLKHSHPGSSLNVAGD